MGLRTASLARRLTRRMIVVQLISLATFFGLVLIPVFVVPVLSGIRNIHPLDPAVFATIEEALIYEPGAPMALHLTVPLERLSSTNPEFWFLAVSQTGQEISYGKIPTEAALIRAGLDRIASLQVILGEESDGHNLLVQTVTLNGETVKIAMGGGPTLGLSRIVGQATLGLLLTVFLVVAIASGIAIPRFIRKEMAGLSDAARTAGSIDTFQRGMRIPESGLPSEVLTLVHAMNEALQRLDEAHVRRERFLADAAHELRTPIAILSARLETAAPFGDQKALLADVSRLGALTNQLLDVQRLSISERILQPVDLVELATAVVADLAPLAIAAGYELELDAAEAATIINGDAASLQSAMTNIVQNAIKYGGRRGTIRVSVAKDRTLVISDDGPGIPDGDEERIFEPFHRSHPSSEGAGLGLSLVQSIVQRHDATISAGRSDTGGARFVISFPVP